MSDLTQERLQQAVSVGASSMGASQLLQEMNREAERMMQTRPSILRRFKTKTLMAIALIALLGGGTAVTAVAAPQVMEWLGFIPNTSSSLVLQDGTTCEVGFGVQPGFGSDAAAHEAATAGQKYLREVNLASLPLQEKLAELADEDSLTNVDESLRVSTALSELVGNGMWNYLGDAGYDRSGIRLEGGVKCSDGSSK